MNLVEEYFVASIAVPYEGNGFHGGVHGWKIQEFLTLPTLVRSNEE